MMILRLEHSHVLQHLLQLIIRQSCHHSKLQSRFSVSQPFFERGTPFFVVSPRGTLTYEAATLRETRACTRSLPSAVVISSCL
jgi:hypothetical protein